MTPGGVYGYSHTEVTLKYSNKVFFKEVHYRAWNGYQGFIKFYCDGELIQHRVIDYMSADDFDELWRKEEFPHTGNTLVDQIVFSKGLDIDLLIVDEFE